MDEIDDMDFMDEMDGRKKPEFPDKKLRVMNYELQVKEKRTACAIPGIPESHTLPEEHPPLPAARRWGSEEE